MTTAGRSPIPIRRTAGTARAAPGSIVARSAARISRCATAPLATGSPGSTAFGIGDGGQGISNASFLEGVEWYVVRGISDYGDETFTRLWRSYAALVAAVYARAVLAACMPIDPRGGHSRATPARPSGDVTTELGDGR